MCTHTRNVDIKFYPEDGCKPPIATASVPEVLIHSGAVVMMVQDLADLAGKGVFIAAVSAEHGQIAHAYGR